MRACRDRTRSPDPRRPKSGQVRQPESSFDRNLREDATAKVRLGDQVQAGIPPVYLDKRAEGVLSRIQDAELAFGIVEAVQVRLAEEAGLAPCGVQPELGSFEPDDRQLPLVWVVGRWTQPLRHSAPCSP